MVKITGVSGFSAL